VASALALVDQAWLQEHAPNGICVGDLLFTNSYGRSDECFTALKDGGYLFWSLSSRPHELFSSRS
jgi:hypothetical protein